MKTRSTRWSRRVRRIRRSLVRGVVAVSAASGTAFPAVVRAYDESFGAGLFVGYTFGPRHGVEWGLEAFATHRFVGTGCSSEPRTGAGPLLQIGLIGLRDPRVTLAAHGGGELARATAALTGELGVTYRFGDKPGFAIHTGIVPETLVLNAAFRYQWLLEDAWVGGGIRFLPTYGDLTSCASTAGRPLRTDSGLARTRQAVRLDEDVRGSRQERDELAGQCWERDAQLECASVPAFLQLARELALHGAPAALVERALDAACDEARHAQMCADLASRHLQQRIVPTLPEVAPRRAPIGRDGLILLAAESWLDGCVAEGMAASRAASAAKVASDSDAQLVQRRIAADEHRHAELGWAILQWTLARGGDDVRDAVRALRGVEVQQVSAADAPNDLERHGRLGVHAIDAVTREHLTASRERLDRVIL